MKKWVDARPSVSGTHHETEEGPLYTQRYEEVLSFHPPGLAPAKLNGQWLHIRSDGEPVYDHRFELAFGFYDGLAAVKEDGKWFHIKPDGSRACDRVFSWCGNYQQGLCVVRNEDGGYHHIGLDGRDAYKERYLYAGDYREGYAVVRRADGCLHIDREGSPLNDRRYLDLGVFHKGFAPARDGYGWYHVDRSGEPLYTQRYSSVEPFYNGLALCLEHGNRLVRIDPLGTVVEVIESRPDIQGKGIKIVLIGNLSSGKTTLGRELSERLGMEFVTIDDCRHAMADGTMAGEYRAWLRFILACEEPKGCVLEFSGGGPHIYDVAKALVDSGLRTYVFWLDLLVEDCIAASVNRRFDAPYPYPLGDIPSLIKHIAAEIETAWSKVWTTTTDFQTMRIFDPRHLTIDRVIEKVTGK